MRVFTHPLVYEQATHHQKTVTTWQGGRREVLEIHARAIDEDTLLFANQSHSDERSHVVRILAEDTRARFEACPIQSPRNHAYQPAAEVTASLKGIAQARNQRVNLGGSAGACGQSSPYDWLDRVCKHDVRPDACDKPLQRQPGAQIVKRGCSRACQRDWMERHPPALQGLSYLRSRFSGACPNTMTPLAKGPNQRPTEIDEGLGDPATDQDLQAVLRRAARDVS
jgi:hypothetical protein